MAAKCAILRNQTTVLTSFPFSVPILNKTFSLSGLRWKIEQIIRQGAVIYVFQNSDHIDQRALVRQWLRNVRLTVSRQYLDFIPVLCFELQIKVLPCLRHGQKFRKLLDRALRSMSLNCFGTHRSEGRCPEMTGQFLCASHNFHNFDSICVPVSNFD